MADTETREERAANLFDLRRIIGGVFVVWGVLLTILGLFDTDAEIEKAAGVNINLWTGLVLLLMATFFLVWALTRPLSDELAEADGEVERPEKAPPEEPR